MRPSRRSFPVLCLVASLVAACGASRPSAAPASASPLAVSAVQPASAAPSSAPSMGLPPLADVPFYRADPLGRVIEPGPGPTGQPQLAWKVAIGETHWAPILVGGLIVAGAASNGLVVALDARTGVERWRFQEAKPAAAPGSLNQAAAAADGMVFVADRSAIYGLDAATGAKRWATSVPNKGERPLVVDGVVYVGATGGALGLDERTGKAVWRWSGPAGAATVVDQVVDGVAIISSLDDGHLYAIGLDDGSEHWRVQTISLTVGSSEVVGDTVYVGTTQAEATEAVGELYAVDRVTGTIRWRFRSPSGRQIVAGPVVGNVLYAGSEQDGIYAIRDDGTTYKEVWHVDAPMTSFPLSLVGDTLYEQRDDGSIGAYATSDLHLLWQTAPTGDNGGGPPLVSGGMVFEVGDQQGVMAFADPTLLATLPRPTSSPSAAPSPTGASVSDPFTIVRAFSWASTRLATPLGIDVGPDGLLYILDMKPSVTVIDPKDGHIIRTWGRKGAGPGEFDLTTATDNPGTGDIAVGPDGRIFVADGSNYRIQVFDPQGHYLSQFGSFGTGPGQFGSLDEIATGRDGSVYVLDLSVNRITRFSAAGKLVWQSPTPSSDPDLGSPLHGIAVRSDGSVLVNCEGCDHFLIFDAADGHIGARLPATGLDGDGGLTDLDPAGHIYVDTFNAESTLVYDASGRLLGGRYLTPGQIRMDSGGSTVTWGDPFWPSPVFGPDGHAYTFNRLGLLELKVTLPVR